MIDAVKQNCSGYRTEDDGAVTVDWVVLTAAVVGMSILVLSSVWQGSVALTNTITTEIENIEIGK